MTDNSRITIVTVGPNTPDRDWESTRSSTSRMIFIESMKILRFALRGAVEEMNLDIHRVVLDRCGSADEYMDLLATLPHNCSADLLMIRDDDSGFLSSLGRGGDRVLYALTATDVRFYLETNHLVTGNKIVAA